METAEQSGKLRECHYCGRKFPRLYPVTGEDIQRKYPQQTEAFEIACGDCLEKLRSIARLVPEYSLRRAVIDASWMVPSFAAVLLTASAGVSLVRGAGLSNVISFSHWLGLATILSGLAMIWERSRNRYGFTHNLRWTLSSRRVLVLSLSQCLSRESSCP